MSDKKFLTFADLKNTPALSFADVYVEEWGGWIRLREMSAGLREWLEGSMIAEAQTGLVTVKDAKGNAVTLDNFRAKVVAASLEDQETGELVFSLEQLKSGEAVRFIGQKASHTVSRLAEEASKLNKLNEEDMKQLGEDSGRGPEGSSDSVSPESSAVPSES